MDKVGSSNDDVFEIFDQGAAWVVRLSSPECEEKDHKDFEAWLSESSENPRRFAIAQHRHMLASKLSNDELFRTQLKRARDADAEGNTRSRNGRRAWWASAAVAVLAIAIVLPIIDRFYIDVHETRFNTHVGEIRIARLDDGSSVRIDTDTEIIVRYSRKERNVEVVRGRAQFDVAPDARLFAVRAADIVARDIGTVFDVSRIDDEIAVALFDGEVIVEQIGQRNAIAKLVPGQMLKKRGDERPALSNFDVNAGRGWVEGNIFVNQQRLDKFISEVNRYSKTKLTIANPEDGAMLISGRYPTDDIDSVLKSLEHGWGLHADRSDPHEIVLKK